MQVDIKHLLKDLRDDITEAVRPGLRAGLLPHEMIVMLLDSGARVGADPRPFIFMAERDSLRDIADPTTVAIEIDLGPVHNTTDGDDLRARSARMLADRFGAQLRRKVPRDTLVVCVVAGSKTAVVAQRMPDSVSLN